MNRKGWNTDEKGTYDDSGIMSLLPSGAAHDELKAERPEFQAVEVKIVDENREKALADSLDYWYVPTYFVDGVKVHEGVPTMEKVRKVYEKALN